ncbi:hypothetical protein ACLOJK_025125 [Asimina triloba]
MSAFDFGNLSERRRIEKQAKQRKRIAIGLSVALVLAVIVACGALAVLHQTRHSSSSTPHSLSSSSSRSTSSKSSSSHSNAGDSDEGVGDGSDVDVATSSKAAIKAMCHPTDYKKECEKTLTEAAGNNHTVDTRELLMASIEAVADELKKGFAHAARVNSHDPMVKNAILDCEELAAHAETELKRTAKHVGNDEFQVAAKSPELKNWVSAVMSYQQTCVDGFPEGDMKNQMKEAMEKSKRMTSNVLAIVGQVASILSGLGLIGVPKRRLLEQHGGSAAAAAPVEVPDDLPEWMSHEEKRLLAEKGKPEPDAVVAQDGSGAFKTITAALQAMPKDHKGRYVIYVKEGTYEEQVTVTTDMVNVTMYGDGSRKTIVTGSKNYVDGVGTYRTATFAAVGDGFMAQDIGFRNTAGAIKHQAVALRVQSDRSVFFNCRMEGYQDTLYAQTHRQFYRSCVICGTIDFIFGDAAAVFQNCQLVVRKPLDNQQNIVTAHGRVDRHESTGFVIQNCKIHADKKLVPVQATTPSYLGRPWKEYSRTIFMETEMDDLIHPDGWMPWDGEFGLNTLVYAEFANTGPGAATAARVNWPGFKVFTTKDEAEPYTAANFIQGGEWIKQISQHTPVRLTFFN